MSVIYHIAERAMWDEALTTGIYIPPTARPESFVLCATGEQYVNIANRLFAGRNDLVLLFIDSTRLDVELQSVETHGLPALRFSSPLPLEAIFETAAFEPESDGHFRVHHETRALSVRADESLAEVHERALRAMAAFPRPWWIAGGWAIDTFLAKKSRPHADLEISVLRSEQRALAQYLQGWDLRVATPGSTLAQWDGQSLDLSQHQIWARQGNNPVTTPDEFSEDPTMLDLLIEDNMGDVWCYRRDPRITRSLPQFGDTREGVPFVRPEVALLFKAKGARFKDQRDFERVLPKLEIDARQWLLTTLQILDPQHPWCKVL